MQGTRVWFWDRETKIPPAPLQPENPHTLESRLHNKRSLYTSVEMLSNKKRERRGAMLWAGTRGICEGGEIFSEWPALWDFMLSVSTRVTYDFSCLFNSGYSSARGSDCSRLHSSRTQHWAALAIAASLWPRVTGYETGGGLQEFWKFQKSEGQEGPGPWILGSGWRNNHPHSSTWVLQHEEKLLKYPGSETSYFL